MKPLDTLTVAAGTALLVLSLTRIDAIAANKAEFILAPVEETTLRQAQGERWTGRAANTKPLVLSLSKDQAASRIDTPPVWRVPSSVPYQAVLKGNAIATWPDGRQTVLPKGLRIQFQHADIDPFAKLYHLHPAAGICFSALFCNGFEGAGR